MTPKRAFVQAKMTIGDIYLNEWNEVFADQAIGCMLELGIEIDSLDPPGERHRHGPSGLQTVARRPDWREGLLTGRSSICIGGGMGKAWWAGNNGR